MEKQILTMSDGADLDVFCWRPAGEPRGLVQIAHGMAEYAERYDAFGTRLAEAGWLVVIHDQRGHGQRALDDGTLGHSTSRGYHQLVDDLSAVADHARAETPGLPWVLVGHSMGSFVARVLAAQRGRELAALVLSGTGASLGPVVPVGLAIADGIIRAKGLDHPSAVLEKLAFGTYNKGIQPRRTDFDWLSRDDEQVDAYVASPLCGKRCSAGFYRELIRLSAAANSEPVLGAYPADLPIGLFSGAEDPVGGVKVRTVAAALRDKGMRNVEVMLYPGARHEILNETNRDEVMDDILTWIDVHVPRG